MIERADDLLRAIRDLGPGAWGALLFGGLALLSAGAALVRGGFGAALTAMLLASLAAGSGLAGQLLTQHRVESSLARLTAKTRSLYTGDLRHKFIQVMPPENGVRIERERRTGYREAQAIGRFGWWVGLFPFLLGAWASGRALRSRPAADGRGFVVLLPAFGLLGLVALGGGFLVSHRPLPVTRYDFDPEDEDAWKLAEAIDVSRYFATAPRPTLPWNMEQRADGPCLFLEETLLPYWGAVDRHEWPRVMRGVIPASLGGWREQADDCARRMLEKMRAPTELRPWDGLQELDLDNARAAELRDLLRASPLLQDEALHARVERWVPTTAEAIKARQEAAPEKALPLEDGALREVLGQ